jgi:TPR repeat protein
MRRSALLVAGLLVGMTGTAYGQSMVQRCEGMLRSRTADAGWSELCQGIFAANGTHGPQDQPGALRHYQRAAELGNAEGQALLGVVYERGWGGASRDIGRAVAWYQKAVQQGHAGAELNLGLLYEKGDGVPKDPARARSLIEAAARQGLAPAQRKLAELGQGTMTGPGTDLWEQGKKRYLAGDHAGAAQLILKAAQAGNPEARNEIGYMYEAGDGIARNYAEAARWYRAGAEQGYARCQFGLGSLYEAGRGVRENWDEAARWYRKSAMQDDEYAMFSLGRAYQFGIGVPLDLVTAITWYDKAAAKGNGQAAYFARYLRDNHGVDGSSRTPEEQAMLGPLVQRMVLTAPPLGHTFHSSAERVAYIRAVAQDESLRKAQMFWNMRKDEYDSCRRAGRDSCHPPGPPPK